MCKIQLWTSGSNAYPAHPLIGLQVIPLEQAVTNAPASHSKVWHISLAYRSPPTAHLERAFARAYKEPRIQRIWFNRIEDHAVSYIHHNDPIALDPVVQALHQAGHFRDVPLHVTF